MDCRREAVSFQPFVWVGIGCCGVAADAKDATAPRPFRRVRAWRRAVGGMSVGERTPLRSAVVGRPGRWARIVLVLHRGPLVSALVRDPPR